jgi:23S rRNA (guanosine2251-2'-O)-methyltransferase
MAAILYGIHPVCEVLKRQEWPVLKIHMDRTSAGRPPMQQIVQTARSRGIPVQLEDKQSLRKLAGAGVHQGVVAILQEVPYADLDDIMSAWRNSGLKATILVLDSVQDPHNLGALVRTAYCAGCHGVVLPKDRSASLTPAAIKASAGAAVHIPVARVTNLAYALDRLRQCGIWIIGTSPESAQDIFETEFDLDLALVMGGEEKGLRPIVRKRCHAMVRIPMAGHISSLNVSVAAGVILFEILRQRRWSRAAT